MLPGFLGVQAVSNPVKVKPPLRGSHTGRGIFGKMHLKFSTRGIFSKMHLKQVATPSFPLRNCAAWLMPAGLIFYVSGFPRFQASSTVQ